MSARFAHLHVHSHYSLLKALPKIPDLVAAAKAEGCEALALTDIDHLYGAIDFYKECTAAGIKPIIGLDANLGDGKRLLLYAKNFEGYTNLLAIVTQANLESEGSPIVTQENLEKHKEGLIVLDPKSTEIALAEIYYLKPEDRRAWETMRAIENRGAAGDEMLEEDDFYFPTGAQMAQRFTEAQLKKTLEIAEQCTLELQIGKFIFPEFVLPEGVTADQRLRELCMAGLKRRGLEGRQDVLERLNYELGIIEFKGYAAYFLVVEDLIRFARESGIYTTIRGSVAGSMTTYLLQITAIDPLEYKIPFERFLNPERPSAPDIDMDYADNRRDEVIEYARQKYGYDRVAQIGTFGTMLARGVVRDVARAMGHPYGLGDRIAKEIPFGSQGFPMTLDRALEEAPDLAKIYKSERDAKEIIDFGKKIEGCARHISVHAAGVVIAPRPLVEFAPLQRDPKGGKIITEYDMYSVGEDGVGLTKFDFLGIRNLSILAAAVELIGKTRGVNIDIERMPLDDKKTYEMLTRGETEGTFQLNGSGMTRFLKELRPTTIHDINAMVALFRPGPMQFIPQYIERKHNPSLVRYLDPAMEPILKQTYGVLVYQDDLLMMANQLAGYTWGEVDKFRKAVGKKIPEEMEKQKEKFINGCVEHSAWPRKKAEAVWAWIEPFAAYGFNKAHAASYGKVAYQTSYLKANYPVEYMAAVLSAEAGDVDTVGIMVAECKRMNIPVLPPDINESYGDFTAIMGKSAQTEEAKRLAAGAAEDAIRFGLYSIKNFGQGVANTIIEERVRGGRFTSISDFLRRLSGETLNKKSLEALIQCGALDSLGERGRLMAGVETLLEFHRQSQKDSSQDSLFAGLGGMAGEVSLPETEPAPLAIKLAWEKELLGLYVSGHPLDQYREQLAKRPMNISEMRERVRPGMITVTGGIIEDIRTILTRSGDQMAFVKLGDGSGSIEAVVFPKSFSEFKEILKPDSCIALKGRLSNRNGELSFVAEKLKAL